MSTFNTVAKEYDAWYKTPLGDFVDEVENKLAFDNLDIKSGMKVLDVGCGTGIYSKRLVEKACNVTGIDIAGKMLDIARHKVPEGRFIKSSVEALPFPKGHFDLVFSMATFEFIEDAEAAYFEMKRVAKAGAQIFIGTINKESKWGELYLSNKHKGNSVFRDSFLKVPSDLLAIDQNCLVKTDGCVYFPPDTPEAQLNWEYEKKQSLTEHPGFITALWQKKV